METLSLHFALELNYNKDASVGHWFLLGVVIRIAMRMGLHRDPSHWPNIRPLEAELRRRRWITLYQLDYLTSTQVGLPRIIKDSQCDTRPPAHLFEDDLGLEDNQLPPERPRDQPTPLLFIIERHPIITLAAEIYDTTEAGPPPPATIAALAAKIQRAVENIPSWLKYKPPEASIAENPLRILQQIFVDILIHKAVYVLHRRSFVKGSGAEDSARSNAICIDAALAILAHQRRMSEETQPGGLMYSVRWRVSSSLNHEFLQATMMLCFALSRPDDGDVSGATSARAPLPRRDDIVEALTHAQSHWNEIADQSVDARRAAQAIAAVLRHDSNQSAVRATAAASNGDYSLPGFKTHPVAEFVCLPGLFDPMPALSEPGCVGSFDYGQDMAADLFDPSFFTDEHGLPTFESMLDDFVPQENDI